MKVKRTVCLLVALMMLLTLAACGEGGDTTSVVDMSGVVEPSSSVTSTVSSEEPAVSDISMTASEEESSEEESSEEETSMPEADYVVEDSFVLVNHSLISRTENGKKLFGIIRTGEDGNTMVLEPEFVSIYRLGDRIVAIKAYDGGEVVLIDKDGNISGEYLSTPRIIGYPTRAWSELGVFAKRDGGYVIYGRDTTPIYDNITRLVIPNPQQDTYLYLETADGKSIVGEIYGDHTLRFAEVDSLEKYDAENYDAMKAVAEKFRTAMAEKDEATFRECMTEKLYRVFKSGTEPNFKLIYGVPRGTITGDMEEYDICAKTHFFETWINPLPGSPSQLVYPSFMPYVQIWLSKGDDGVWRVCDICEEGDA